MTWTRVGISDSFRRADGARVHRIAGDEWAAALPGRGGIPCVVRDTRGHQMRKFAGANAAMAWLDAADPQEEIEHGR